MKCRVDKRLRQASGKLDVPLGGFSVILIGDFGQLPPVCDKPLYAPPSTHSLSLHGSQIYQLFDKVVILQQLLRQQGADPDTARFRELLQRLRNCAVTQEDWQLLLQRAPHAVPNLNAFDSAIRLFYDKQSVATYNLEKLQQLGQPIAHIHAIHSTRAAASAKTDDAGGLQATAFLAVGARVMLTANLWAQVGLCNGAAGSVMHILYPEGQCPPSMPIAVIVKFDAYTGPNFLDDCPQCVPIPLTTFEWESSGQRLSRQQIPLQLHYAITIHKSQGQTLQHAVIDLGKRELAASCTFVALSRLPRLDCAIIQPMPFQRLTSLSSSINFIKETFLGSHVQGDMRTYARGGWENPLPHDGPIPFT